MTLRWRGTYNRCTCDGQSFLSDPGVTALDGSAGGAGAAIVSRGTSRRPPAPTQAPAQPQRKARRQPQKSEQTITKVVNLVDVLFTVLNRRNKLVPALEKSDFKIFDDKLPQEIRYFSKQTDLPLRIGMLLDTSNSIRDRIKFEQDASVNFLYSVLRRNKDEAFVMTFDDEPQIVQAFHRRYRSAARPDHQDARGRRHRDLRRDL